MAGPGAPILGALVLSLASTGLAAQQASGTQTGQASSEAQAAELAKKLANPIASLISVPIKYVWEDGIGPDDLQRQTLIVQPVIPVEVNADWNVIIRTIVPYLDADLSSGGSLSGTGDILQSFFFSPKAPTTGGWVWGAGPVISYPSASKDALGTEQWSVGPTFVALRQSEGWTWGILANHLWSVTGEDAREDVSATFVQPFVSYTTPRHTTWGLNTESTYDWKSEQATVPINLQVSQLMRFGRQPVSLALGYRYYADAPEAAPDWGLFFTFTLLYPK
jgi:hypothetical protein